LGQVYFDLDRYNDALSAFTRALELAEVCSGPGSATFQLMIRFNILAARIQLDVLTDDDSFPRDLKLEDLSREDQVSLLRRKAVAYSKTGRHAEAVAPFADLDRKGVLDSATVITYSASLLELGRRSDAELLLREKAGEFQDVNLYHHLADML